ncbi:hypothetical protein BB560_006176 [Smittium megazygosporum]|uniref:Protein kinase domain-containing protein n=1 Tax=Smittium megazygosporum TaxID=133381 RepID=A0A2T9YEN1_9FUNG|nr:hypothetical protein BB560_006176 [Smittium megazygosporum]
MKNKNSISSNNLLKESSNSLPLTFETPPNEKRESLSDSQIGLFKKRKHTSSFSTSSVSFKGKEMVIYRPQELTLYHQPSNNIVVYDPLLKTISLRQKAPLKSSAEYMEAYKGSKLEYFKCPVCSTRFNKEWSEIPDTPTSSREFRPHFSKISKNITSEVDLNPENISYYDSNQSGLNETSFNNGYYKRFFIEGTQLGKGLRGSVFHCQHVLENVLLGEYAIKKVAVGNDHQWLLRMLKEVKLLERLHHPNVIEYKHSWLEMHKPTKFGNLSEFIESGGLYKFDSGAKIDKKPLSRKEKILLARGLPSSNQNNTSKLGDTTPNFFLSLEHIWIFLRDICSGLNHLHKNGIIHRDLKPQNLLLFYDNFPSFKSTSSSSSKIPRLLLADFGECETLFEEKYRTRTGATGTLEFMAPELLRVDGNGKYLDDYSTKADMWSLGMLLYYMCYSSLPFTEINDIDRLKKDVLGLRLHLPKVDRGSKGKIPSNLKLLITKLLNQNKSKRPDIAQILPMVTKNALYYENSNFKDDKLDDLFELDETNENQVFENGIKKIYNDKSDFKSDTLFATDNQSHNQLLNGDNLIKQKNSYKNQARVYKSQYLKLTRNYLGDQDDRILSSDDSKIISFNKAKSYTLKTNDSGEENIKNTSQKSLVPYSSSLPTESYMNEYMKSPLNMHSRDLKNNNQTFQKLRSLSDNTEFQINLGNLKKNNIISVDSEQDSERIEDTNDFQTKNKRIKEIDDIEANNKRIDNEKDDQLSNKTLFPTTKPILSNMDLRTANSFSRVYSRFQQHKSDIDRLLPKKQIVAIKYVLFIIKINSLFNGSAENKLSRFIISPLFVLAAIDLRRMKSI